MRANTFLFTIFHIRRNFISEDFRYTYSSFLPKAINTDKSQEKQVCWFQKLRNEERDQTILAGLQI